MDKKPGPSAPDAPEAEPERTKVARHRFAEGETRIMRLDEILRQRTPEAVAPPTTAKAPAPLPVSQASRPASGKLNAQEKQILAVTEPAEHTVMVRREDLLARAQAERSLSQDAKPPAMHEERTAIARPMDLADKARESAAKSEATTSAPPHKTPRASNQRADTSAFGGETRVFSLDQLAKRSEPIAPAPAAAARPVPAAQKAASQDPPAGSAAKPPVPPVAASQVPPQAAAAKARPKAGDLTPPPSFLPAGDRPSLLPPPSPEATAAILVPPAPPSPPTAATPTPPTASSLAAAIEQGTPSPAGEQQAKEASQEAVAQATGTPSAQATPATSQRRVANQVTVVFSSKGGSGATSMAVTTAHTAALDKHSACVLDLDLQLGDSLAACGLPPRLSLAQTVQAIAEGQGIGKSLLPVHASGVHVVSQVGNLNDLDKITPDSISSLVAGLRLAFEAVVIDGVRDFGDNALAVLDGADKVALVVVQEVLSIRRARWAYSILGKIGFEAEDITVVVNRFAAQGDISLASVQQMFPGSPVVPVVSNPALVTQALDRGVPLRELKSDASVTKSFVGCVEHLVYDIAPPTTPTPGTQMIAPKRSLWQRFFGGGKQKSAP